MLDGVRSRFSDDLNCKKTQHCLQNLKGNMVSLQVKYGMKRLAKVEKTIEEKLEKQTKRYNKS